MPRYLTCDKSQPLRSREDLPLLTSSSAKLYVLSPGHPNFFIQWSCCLNMGVEHGKCQRIRKSDAISNEESRRSTVQLPVDALIRRWKRQYIGHTLWKNQISKMDDEWVRQENTAERKCLQKSIRGTKIHFRKLSMTMCGWRTMPHLCVDRRSVNPHLSYKRRRPCDQVFVMACS